MGQGRTAPLAAPLSFLLPGLGQLWLGRRRRGLLLALLPVLVGLAALAIAGAVIADPLDALALLPGPALLPALLLLDAILLLDHLVAVLDADRLARLARPVRGWRRIPVAVVLAALLVGTVGLHGAFDAAAIVATDATGSIFDWDGGNGGLGPIPEPSWTPSPSPSPTPLAVPTPSATLAPSETPSPSPTPSPTPAPLPAWARDGRLDLLLIGSDAGPDRVSLRTDTMIVLSVDLSSGHAALMGIPRNLIGVPLAPESAAAVPGGRFPGMLNALYRYAMDRPALFPGGSLRGLRAVSGAVQELLGVRIDGMAIVNLAGFVRLVDELGGLWIDIPAPLVDAQYPLEDGSALIRIAFSAGCQHLDGRMALAYARSRHQDSDYGRMRRQQTVLLSLRRQLDPVKLVARAPALLGIAHDDLWTSLRVADLPAIAKALRRVDAGRVSRVVFAPPAYPETITDSELARIRSVARTIVTGPLPKRDGSLAAGHCP